MSRKPDLSRDGKAWTREEEDMLEELVGTMNFNTIGGKMGRSAKAIERKLTRMGLINTKLESGMLSNLELCTALQTHNRVTMRWMEQHGMPLKRKNMRFGKNIRNSWFIDPEKFWRWARKNKDIVNFTRYVPGSIMPEPSWLQEAIKVQLDTIPNKVRKPWKPEDDNLLWQLYYVIGLPQKEIAVQLGRTTNSIERRLARLRAKKLKGGEA